MKKRYFRNRYFLYDNTKGFLIYCVVLGHVVERFLTRSYFAARVQFWIYLFHMPAFIFLAGMFSKKAVNRARRDKALSYLLLFYLMKAAFYAAAVFLRGKENAEFLVFSEDGIPWFCMAMCWWYLLTILVRNVRPALVAGVSVVLAAAAGYIPQIGSFLVLLRTVNFFPFFYLGYCARPEALVRLTRDRRVRAAGFLLLAASLAAAFSGYDRFGFMISLLRGRYRYSEIGTGLSGISGGLCRLAALAVSFILTLAVLSVFPDRKTPLAAAGRRTLPVYVFHGLFITLLIGRFEAVKNWLLSGRVFTRCAAFSLLVLLLSMLPPFVLAAKTAAELPSALYARIHEQKQTYR